MDTKVCSQCHLPKPLDAFARNRNKPDGHAAACKACINGNEDYRQHRQRKREERRDQALAWQAANPERYAAGQLSWRVTHRTRRSARVTQRRQENPAPFRAYRQQHYAANSERLSEYERQKRARKRNAPVYETVLLTVLYARDKGLCGLCHLPVPEAEASVDHIVPISKNGEHSYRNTQLAHRRCNSRKGNRHTPSC